MIDSLRGVGNRPPDWLPTLGVGASIAMALWLIGSAVLGSDPNATTTTLDSSATVEVEIAEPTTTTSTSILPAEVPMPQDLADRAAVVAASTAVGAPIENEAFGPDLSLPAKVSSAIQAEVVDSWTMRFDSGIAAQVVHLEVVTGTVRPIQDDQGSTSSTITGETIVDATYVVLFADDNGTWLLGRVYAIEDR